MYLELKILQKGKSFFSSLVKMGFEFIIKVQVYSLLTMMRTFQNLEHLVVRFPVVNLERS